jgi:iron complex transport system substrate-binding protein
VSLEPNSLTDIWSDIRKVSAALGAPARADQLIDRLENRMNDLSRRARAINRRPTIACIEWIEPLMAAGNWMPELVDMAGGTNLFGEAGKHSPWMTWAEMVASDPEVIFVSPCGFDINRTLEEMHILRERPEWKGLKAVSSDSVFVADGNQYFNRPGPRVVESLEILAEVVHPEEFHFGYEGKGWVRYR